ncbi:MAG TPA: CHRD domain-containing protein [Noviherbaspirillum sp.]
MPVLYFKLLFPRIASSLALVLLSACGGTDDDLPFAFSATLTGAEEVPSNASAATGIGLVTVDPDGRTLTASVIASGMADNDAHIHEAPAREAGPVLFPLAMAPGTVVWSTRTALTDAQFAALRNGRYYFNVHSPTFPGGEIRGQIVWILPTPAELGYLHQFRQQSLLLDQQLQQVAEIEDARDGRFTGIGWGLTVGF